MRSPVVLLSVLFSLLVHGVHSTACNATNQCTAEFPCCSEFGYCGTDDFCVAGCNPFASYTVNSCKPNPICQDATYNLVDTSRILMNASLYDGTATQYDWLLDTGKIIPNPTEGDIALTLTEKSGGTRVSSIRYLHYGRVTARLKAGRWGGVVTAFITMSDIKDEIDWEFPGAVISEAQTNYFWRGVFSNGFKTEAEKGIQDTFSTYHDYTIDWQPKTLVFSIDDRVVRVVHKEDTVDPNTKVAHFPSTPSRIQLSIWPAGINTSAEGTVNWAGGMINWKDPDYLTAGQFYARFKSVTVKCGDPTSPSVNMTSYIYSSTSTANSPVVAFSNGSSIGNGAALTFSYGLQWRGATTLATVLMLASFIL